jgi:hypothetical protein
LAGQLYRLTALFLLLAVVVSPILAQKDSVKADSVAAKRDTVKALPEVHRVKLPAEDERIGVLAVGLTILGGFVILLLLKKREADRSVGD